MAAEPLPAGAPRRQRSLFGEILDWMLVPLLLVWPLSIGITFLVAQAVANRPFDNALSHRANVLADLASGDAHFAVGLLPALQRADVELHQQPRLMQLRAADGSLIGGDPDIPPPPDLRWAKRPGVQLRDAMIDGRNMRVASRWVEPQAQRRHGPGVLVQVAESMGPRSALAREIMRGVILPQFVIIPLAVLLVWFGLSQGLKPLIRLRDRIEARAENDLSPIRTRRVPEELQPLIDAFNAMLERMRSNLDAQQRFIADAAHQMRTPLTGLKTQAQLAMRQTDPAELHDSLRQIATGVDRAAHLVNQLLTLARAEASAEAQNALEPLDLDALLRSQVEEWVMRALDRDIDLGYEPSAPAEILGSAFLLRELISNLIDNALRYTPGGGHVTCRVVVQGDFVTLEVEDNGIGITEEQAALVFERFYRVDGTGAEGSGLGLAIVREIAEQHHGVATLRPNQRERGAVARVVFPRHRPHEPEFDAQIEGELGYPNPPTGFV